MSGAARHPILTYAAPGFVARIIALLSAQAVLNATGTWALTRAGGAVADPARFLTYVAWGLALSLLPNALVVLIRRTEMRGFLATYYAFLNERFESRRGRPALWSARSRREMFLTSVGSEAEQYLGALAYSTFDLYAFGLNIVLTALVLSLTIDANFAWAFLASAVISLLVYLSQRRAIRGLIDDEQTALLSLGAHVLRSWDNVLLRNEEIHDIYRRGLRERYERAHDLTGRAAFRAELSVFALNVASSIPPFALIVWIIVHHGRDVGLLGALVTTIPRQIENLRTFRFFFQQLTNARIFRTRFDAALRNSQFDEVDLRSLVQISRVTIDGRTYASVEDALNALKAHDLGRVTIRGTNGAGKSSLLLLLHAELPASFYLPPGADLDLGGPPSDLSTGQTRLRQLQFLRETRAPILLLDEWDANLDRNRRAEIDADLDQISRSRLVIEVRH